MAFFCHKSEVPPQLQGSLVLEQPISYKPLILSTVFVLLYTGLKTSLYTVI